MIELDDTDIKILKVLNQEGRKPLVEIAKKINTSADTVNYRIKNLEQKGLITGFGTKINFSEMGNNYSIIFFKMQNMNSEKYLKLETWAKFNQKVVVLMKTLGDHEVEIELVTSNKLWQKSEKTSPPYHNGLKIQDSGRLPSAG